MRGARRLLLLGIVLILGVVGLAYHLQKSRQAQQAPPPPDELPPNVDATSTDWVHRQDVGNRTKIEIRARRMRQVKEPSEFELEGVELRIYDVENGGFDQIRSPYARFDTRQGTLFSASEVNITLGVPEHGPPPNNLLTIRTSGVRLDTVTARATTDQPTSFTYGRAEGHSIGATYDPGWKDLRMHSNVVLHWHGESPGEESMRVEAGQLVYKEDQSKIYLSPWSRFSKGGLTLQAADSVVTLEEDAIRVLDTQRARGEDRLPSRKIEYAADHLVLEFARGAVVEKVVGEGNARLASFSPASEMSVAADRMFLEFQPAGKDSLLDNALGMGGGVLELRPGPRQTPAPETRVLRSEVIKVIMRAGGEVIDVVETHARATLEFLPNGPEQKRRRLDGERLWMWFGPENRLTKFRAARARTRTDNGRKGNQVLPPSLTSSEALLAEFEPETGKLLRVEQWGEFRYEEGDRKAVAGKAVLDTENNRITLLDRARVWDAGGSTAADEIILDQNEEVHTATVNVNSTRLPSPSRAGGGLLSPDEAFHAAAGRMVATADGVYVVYEGGAVVWQGPNRIQGDRIEIDRSKGTLKAAGRVISRFVERQPKEGGSAETDEVFTTVRAHELTYMEEHKMADYEGDVYLSRPGLEITAGRLRAYFGDAKADEGGKDSGARLRFTIAEAGVRIVHRSQGRTRTGLAEQGEYYIAEDRVVLKGGRPRVIDSVKGATEGKQLTYFARDDRLLVEGAEGQPAVSRIRRR